MPDADEEIISRVEEALKKVRPVSSMIADGVSAKGIIAELMAGFEMDYLSSTELAFRCKCNRERIEDVLLSLSHADMQALVDDGQAEVCCQFCGEKYHFEKDELVHLMKLADGIDRIGITLSFDLQIRCIKMGICSGSQMCHQKTIFSTGYMAALFVRRLSAGNEIDPVKTVFIICRFCRHKVAVMDGIKGPAHDTDLFQYIHRGLQRSARQLDDRLF